MRQYVFGIINFDAPNLYRLSIINVERSRIPINYIHNNVPYATSTATELMTRSVVGIGTMKLFRSLYILHVSTLCTTTTKQWGEMLTDDNARPF